MTRPRFAIVFLAVAVTTLQAQPAGAQVGAPSKPTRGFFSALVHNLGDDVKHIPRKDSVYWLAGGSALALTMHPEDRTINRRLLGKPNGYAAAPV